MKTLDVKTKSITEVKKDLSKIIKNVNSSGEPTYIFNHNKPEAVILSHAVYEELVRKQEELEEQLFYTQLSARVNEGPGKLVSSEEVMEMEEEDNPFDSLSDEALFD